MNEKIQHKHIGLKLQKTLVRLALIQSHFFHKILHITTELQKIRFNFTVRFLNKVLQANTFYMNYIGT